MYNAEHVPHPLTKAAYLGHLAVWPRRPPLPVVFSQSRLCIQAGTVLSYGSMRPANDQTTTDQTTDQRLSVSEAAALLGLSEDAVRSRLKRGTLRKDKAKDGTVLVVLGEGQPTDRPTNNNDQPTTDQTGTRGAAQEDLVESLLDQVAYMREQLAQEREANRENRRLLAAALERIPPQLEAPEEPSPERRESSTTPTEEPYSTHAPPPPQDPVERPSWWRRFFGFE